MTLEPTLTGKQRRREEPAAGNELDLSRGLVSYLSHSVWDISLNHLHFGSNKQRKTNRENLDKKIHGVRPFTNIAYNKCTSALEELFLLEEPFL